MLPFLLPAPTRLSDLHAPSDTLPAVNLPSPALVAQGAVRRLPRAALALLVIAYALPGFWGREPWKSADVAAFGYMAEIARGGDWWQPALLGAAPDFPALLPYWLGALAIKALSPALAPEVAVRLPFLALLVLALLATWHAIFHLARSPGAQPVAFAFGGEASPQDYARAIADAGLLALIACLGLAQFSHETTPALAQLAFTATILYGAASMPYRLSRSLSASAAGLFGLALSGAPHLALAFGLSGAAVWRTRASTTRPDATRLPWAPLAAIAVASYAVAAALGMLHWNLGWPGAGAQPVDGIARALVWFTWPAGPLALWSLWRWRGHWRQPHLALPLGCAAIALTSAVFTAALERSLLLGLPALAALAAFALPTLRRSLAALIDWFTLLFFSGCAFVIWVIWIAMQTGVPAKPAANVARLAPGFEHDFSWPLVLPALLASLLWAWLVAWRVGRHRAAIWKSMVLPAGGATLCWLLLMTLWLPLLDHARSHRQLIEQIAQVTRRDGCIEVQALARGQVAALLHVASFELKPYDGAGNCPWLLLGVGTPADLDFSLARSPREWEPVAMNARVESREAVRLLRRVTGVPP